jgi:hypothetical protein
MGIKTSLSAHIMHLCQKAFAFGAVFAVIVVVGMKPFSFSRFAAFLSL